MLNIRAIFLFLPLLVSDALVVGNRLLLFPPTSAAQTFVYTAKSPRLLSRASVDVSVSNIAKQVSVRIFANSDTGSGAIIERRGQTYTVITCAHVVASAEVNKYKILTADGKTHWGQWLRTVKFADADLAIVQFSSDRIYQKVAIADSEAVAIGDSVYAAGFPNWHWANSDTVRETSDWGTKAFRLTNGKVAMLPEKSLQEGYQLGYTNQVEEGMSGGPVLNQAGQLIAINGRLKYPLQGISAYVFADGTMPSQELFQKMEALSWAVPYTRFRQALK